MTTTQTTRPRLPKLTKLFKKRMEKENNCFFLVYSDGKSGVGKSYMGLTIAETLDPAFSAEQIVFDVDEFIHLVTTLPEGSIILFDDAGVEADSRTFLGKDNIEMRHVIETMRSRLISVIFTVPGVDMIDATIRHMATLEIRVKQHGYAWVYKCGYNRGYEKYYIKRVFDIGHRKNINKRLAKPSLALEKAYKDRKAQFQLDLYAAIEERRAERDAKRKEAKRSLNDVAIAKLIISNGLVDKYRDTGGDFNLGRIAFDFECAERKAAGVARLIKANIN
jgi:ABC-type dipeptide/oligopeptide/nickel transport system ATPase component